MTARRKWKSRLAAGFSQIIASFEERHCEAYWNKPEKKKGVLSEKPATLFCICWFHSDQSSAFFGKRVLWTLNLIPSQRKPFDINWVIHFPFLLQHWVLYLSINPSSVPFGQTSESGEIPGSSLTSYHSAWRNSQGGAQRLDHVGGPWDICVSLCLSWGARGSWKRASDLLELEVQDAWNLTVGLWKSQKCLF